MKNIAIFLVAAFLLASCSKNKKQPPPVPPISTKVEKESLAPEGCLNLPIYFSLLQTMPQNTPVTEISTDFELTSSKSVRPNFKKLMAYSTFRAGTRSLAEFQEFQGVSQSSCRTVTLQSADGTQEDFTITEHSPTMLMAKNQDGRVLRYIWLGPQRLKIDLRYHAFDIPCTEGKHPALVREVRVLDWSPVPLSAIAVNDPEYAINQGYLATVAEVVGKEAEDLYEVSPTGERSLALAKAGALSELPPREELLACRENPTPLPPPEEQPPSEPNPPEDEPGDGSGSPWPWPWP